MKKLLLAVVAVAAMVFGAKAVDIYVDALAAAGGDGSAAAPFQTIRAGVDAANQLTGESSTVFVRGGSDRTYNIVTVDDAITVSAPNVTICAWGDYGKPHIEISNQFSVNMNSNAPNVIHFSSGADYGEAHDLDFYFYSYNAQSRPGNSLGQSGKVLAITANHCLADGCEFHQSGVGNWSWGGDGCVASLAEQGTHNSVGRYLIVRNCQFEGIKRGDSSVRAVRAGDACEIYNNVYTDCNGYFYPVKQTSGGFFCSNRVVNCTKPLYSNGGNYGEISNYEIAYNIFVNSGVTFLQKEVQGMSGTVKVHHNTVIGCDKFILLNKASMTPTIFDNLIISPTGTLIVDDNTTIPAGQTSGFKAGSSLKGNAYLVGAFNGGTAAALDGYDLGDLEQSDNNVLSLSPEFENTEDVLSEEFYRLNATRYPWVLQGTSGPGDAYPAYIGAVEPSSGAKPGEYFQIDAFTSEGDTYAPAEIMLKVQYSQNAGVVTIFWDFEGDGIYDESSTDTEVNHTYQVGLYTPKVKAVDAGTGKEVFAELAFPLDITLEDAYVDANAAVGGDGTIEHPFLTIREGVQNCAANGTVHVKGGDDRTYDIATLDDFVTFSRSGISVEPWVAGERVKIVLARGLHKLNASPKVFTISAGADNVKVSGLDLLLYGGGNTSDNYSIWGNNESSAVFLVAGNGAVLDDCSFEIEGSCNEGRGGYMVRTTAEQSSTQPGQDIMVKNCRFANLGEYVFRSGLNPTFVGNSVTNCVRLVYPLKAAWCDFTFVSNRLVNCGTFRTTVPNWNELQKGVFAYNIFVTENGTPFITKGVHGLTDKDVYIHHNTVIGGPLISVLNSTVSWVPRIFDNVVSSPDGYVIVETGTAFASGNYSSFKTDGGAFFRNNAYYALALNGGTATEVPGYDLSKGLLVENNFVLAAAPVFMSTDPASPDFYRPKQSKNPTWIGKGKAWTDDGKYPAYIGAVEPLVAGGMTILIR